MRAALAIAALYATCILAPHVALAFGGSAHCLTEVPVAAHVHAASVQSHHHHSDAAAHGHAVHGDAAQLVDDHATVPLHHHGDGKEHSGNCCGLFCISAIAQSAESMITPSPIISASFPASAEELAGRGPARINRPPIV